MSVNYKIELMAKEAYLLFLRELPFVLIILLFWMGVIYINTHNPVQTMAMNWHITAISFIAAIIANGTAVGGGFVFMPLFSFYYGVSGTESLKLALATQAFGMSAGSLSWPRKLILWRFLAIACIGSSLGMVLGTFYWIPANEQIHIVFGLVSVLLGIGLLIEIALANHRTASPRFITKQQLVSFFILCIGGGLVNAWVSIGIGEIVALWLLFKWRFSIAQSVATGVCVLAFCSILGTLFHVRLGGIPWNFLLFTAPGVILGGRFGAKLGIFLSTSDSKNNPGNHLKFFVATIILMDGVVVFLNTL